MQGNDVQAWQRVTERIASIAMNCEAKCYEDSGVERRLTPRMDSAYQKPQIVA